MKSLSHLGLNIFSSLKMEHFPIEIQNEFQKLNIVFSPEDTLYVIGQGGKEMWSHLDFSLSDPIDHLVIEQINCLDKMAQILYPHSQIIIPLQKIGRLMNISRPSLMGIDISEQFGLWFAYRGVFLSKKSFETITLDQFTSPCESCADKPCINSCPASAVDAYGPFKLKSCLDFRLNSGSICKSQCIARSICPYKQEHQYSSDQINYHMLNSINHIKK